jgi:hypothetical protein
MANVTVDITAINELQKDLEEMTDVALRRLGERGYQLLRLEIKNTAYVTGNLLQGVSTPDFDFVRKQAVLTVTARSAKRGARAATLHLKNGKTKQITLRGASQFNYAETVAKGRPALRAKQGRALLIPVSSAPSGESYIVADGQVFVVRKTAKAVKPNPYDERAAKRLQDESVKIVAGVIEDFA